MCIDRQLAKQASKEPLAWIGNILPFTLSGTLKKQHFINCKRNKTPEPKQNRQKVQEFGVPSGVYLLRHTGKKQRINLVQPQVALMLDSGRFNLQANADKIQHLLWLCDGIYRCIYGENNSSQS